MKILVTGGGGFLGRYIIRQLLAEGHQAVAYQRSDHPDLRTLGVEVVQGSLLEKDCLRQAMQGCDTVIHTAARAGVWGSRKSYFKTNVEGTLLLLETMEKEGIQRLVHTSTPSVVFTGEPFRGADESLPYGSNWLCAYAETKMIAEHLALEWSRLRNWKTIALRPHLIWGVGDPHLLPVIMQRAANSRLRIIGNGRNRVDLTRVENAAAAHLCALRALDRPEAINRPYFISQGEPIHLWKWIQDLLQRMEIPPPQKSVSLKAAYRVGYCCEILWRLMRLRSMPPMTRFVATELGKDHWFSIEAARSQLGYQPEKYPLEPGIQAYVSASHRQ